MLMKSVTRHTSPLTLPIFLTPTFSHTTFTSFVKHHFQRTKLFGPLPTLTLTSLFGPFIPTEITSKIHERTHNPYDRLFISNSTWGAGLSISTTTTMPFLQVHPDFLRSFLQNGVTRYCRCSTVVDARAMPCSKSS